MALFGQNVNAPATDPSGLVRNKQGTEEFRTLKFLIRVLGKTENHVGGLSNPGVAYLRLLDPQ